MATRNKTAIYTTEFPGINSVRFIDSKTEGLAKSRRSTGELVLNLFYWRKLKPEHKFFVVGHECGHIVYDTHDEIKADEFANDLYTNAGLSLTESVKALSEHLDRNKPVHIARAWLQYQRALKYDYEKNKNLKAYRDHYDDDNDVKNKLLNNEF